MNREVEAYEGELALLRKQVAKFTEVVRLNASSNEVFICGVVGERDVMGLPDKLLVCPAEGLDGFAVYTKTTDYSAPGY